MQFEQLGPYRLSRRLGRGGMGTVYEGLDVEAGQPAAVKVLNPHLAVEEGFRERFEIEIESLKKLKHPNIVRLYGFGQQDGHLYYAMELVHGTNLEDELQAGRRFNWRETVHLGIKLARALKHAHDHGVIHRDLKPANLLLTPDGDLKLADFGIARLFGNTRLTSAGGLIGTAEYMAPEQADGRGVTPLSDLYSLGGVMFAMLAGRPPFGGGSLPEVLQLQRFADPPRVSQFARDVPHELEEIITRLLAKEPSARGANAGVIARQLSALEHALSPTPQAGEQRVAGPISPLKSSSTGQHGEPTVKNGLPAIASDQTLDDPRVHPAEAGGATRDAGAPTPPPRPAHSPRAMLPTQETALPPLPSANAPSSPLGDSSVVEGSAAEQSGNGRRSDPGALTSAPSDDGATVRGEVSASVLSADAALASAIPAAQTAGPRANRFVTVEEDERRRAEEEYSASGGGAVWLQIAGLAAALVALIGLGVYLMWPLSADKLFDRIEAVAAGPQSEHLADAEDNIKDFLRRFPDDSRAAKLKSYQEEIELQRLERQLQRAPRLPALGSSVLPIQRDFTEAIALASAEPHQAAAKLQAILDVYGQTPNPSERTGQFLELTRRHLKQLSQQMAQQAAERLASIDEKLQQAKELQATDPAKARAIWRGIIELYGDKPWAAERVAAAKQSLAAGQHGGQ